MTDEQFYIFMACLGFGFGSLFWFFIIFLVFGWKGGT